MNLLKRLFGKKEPRGHVAIEVRLDGYDKMVAQLGSLERRLERITKKAIAAGAALEELEE